MRLFLRRLGLSLELLLERRAGIYLTVDGLILFGVLVGVLVGGEPEQFYMAALLPCLIVGVPILSDAIALERRAGSLDLALSSPGASYYFERRVLVLCVVMAVQGCLVLLLIRFAIAPFFVLPVLVQTLVSSSVVGAAVLFWAVRLRGPGAVGSATLMTLGACGPWLLANPIHRGWMTVDECIDWLKTNLVLGLAAVVLYLYARRRLTRPERLLS